MHGGLRVDVFERQAVVVFVDDLGGNFAFDNAGEEGFFCRHDGVLVTKLLRSQA